MFNWRKRERERLKKLEIADNIVSLRKMEMEARKSCAEILEKYLEIINDAEVGTQCVFIDDRSQQISVNDYLARGYVVKWARERTVLIGVFAPHYGMCSEYLLEKVK